MSLISIADLSLYIGKTITDTTDEEKYNYLIESVQDQADSICYRKLEQNNYSETYDGNGTELLFLNQFPIVSIDTISYGSVFSGSTRTEIESDDYLVYSEEGYLAFQFNSIENINQGFLVSYTAGYSSGDPSGGVTTPTDLKTILMDEIEKQKNKSFTNPEMKSEKIGDYSYTKSDLNDEQNISSFTKKLRKYIRVDIG